MPSLSTHADHPAARQVGVLFGPVAGAALAGRVLEFAIATSALPGGGVGAALAAALLPMGVVAGVTGLVWVALVYAHRSPVESVGASAMVGGAFALATKAALPAGFRPWMSADLAGFVRTDLLAVLALAALFGVSLGRAGPGTRQRVLRAGRLAAGLLFVAFVLDGAYLATVGAPLDGQLLRYTVANAAQLAPVVASEVAWEALGLPLVLVAGLALSWVWARRRAEAVWAMPVQTLALCAAAAAGLAMAPGPPQGLVVRLLGADPLADEVEGDALAAAVGTLDTRALRLVPTAGTRRLNVVVVVMESTRRRSTTPYAPGLATTPFLDSLARRGALVERMTTPVPHTNKSLVSIFGGVYPYPHPEWAVGGVENLPVRGLPRLLRDVGYGTAFFTPAEFAYERKDRIVRSLGFETLAGATDLPAEGFALKAYFGHEDRIALGPALAWVDRQTAANRPFLLGVLTLTAHHPYDTPPGWPLRRFDADPEVNQYLNALRYQDAFLAELWRGIERRGLAGQTALVVVGDHGEAFGEHGFRTHSEAVWEEVLEVPGVVVAPGIAPGTRVRGERSTLDVLPTVADVLDYQLRGATPPGTSLLRPVAPDRVLYHYSRASDVAGAVRRGPLKTMTWWGRRPAQVFNLAADPGEVHPLADANGRVAEDERALRRWRAAAVAFYRSIAEGG